MMKCNYLNTILSVLSCFVFTTEVQGQIPDLPIDPFPLDTLAWFEAHPGMTHINNYSYRGNNVTSNRNTCTVEVNAPVDIAFRFTNYQYHRNYGPLLPSGLYPVNLTFNQTYSRDGETLVTKNFHVSVNTSTMVLNPECDTLSFLLPGTYILEFNGIDSQASVFPNLNTVSPNTTIVEGPVHYITVEMEAIAIPEPSQQIPFETIPSPDNDLPPSMAVMTGKNSITAFTSVDGSMSTGIKKIEYVDGLGRSEELVDVSVTPNHKDLVTYKEYDGYGREYRQWLPASMQNSTGEYASQEECAVASISTNGNDSEPYSFTVYEPSPLNRISEQFGCGSFWHTNNKRIVTEYLLNRNDDNHLICKNYEAHAQGSTGMTVSCLGNYAEGKLQVNKITDEDGNAMCYFIDMQGQTVLIRQITENGKADTYYIYDGLGRLCAILPPELSAQATGGFVDGDLIDMYAYLYKYNDRGLVSNKKLPGKDWIYYEYDIYDRLQYSQDGEQRLREEKTFYLYDVFGRECIRGIGKDHNSSLAVTNVEEGTTVCYTGNNSDWMGYDGASVNLTDIRITHAYFYDNYKFLLANSISLPDTSPLYGEEAVNPQGLLTGEANLRLNDDSLNVVYDYSLFKYDSRNRMIHSEVTNIQGGIDIEDIELNFTGLPTKKLMMHQWSSNSDITQLYEYEYDHALRLTKKSHSTNGAPSVLLADNTYDELGRIIEDRRNGHEKLKTTYGYNVRSWITGIESQPFKEYLYYNTSHNGSVPRFGGGISSIDYKVGRSTQGYNFSYDTMSRLIGASYTTNGNANSTYNTHYTYDLMGNMLTLVRNGSQDSGFGAIDDVTFTYNGNQLIKADDDATDPTYAGAFNFVDGASANIEYEYDLNGNMTKDLNKNISSIQYNCLNLPQEITFSNGNMIKYAYSSDGKKQKASYYTRQMNQTQLSLLVSRIYCSSMIFEYGTLMQIFFDGGYVTLSGTTPNYHFYLKDHLGNNQMVVSGSGTILQRNFYYPFGGLMSTGSSGDLNRFKFNGKELDRIHGLDWYDYGARFYDAATGRWPTMDPLAEKKPEMSPYAFCGNNPVSRIDPNGLDWYQDEFGHLQWNSDLNADNWQDILSEESKYIGTTAYSFEHDSGIAYFGNENGVLSPYKPFGEEGVVVTGIDLSNTLKAQLFGNSGSLSAGQYSLPNSDAISIGVGGSVSLNGIDYGIETGLIVGNGIISPYLSVYGDLDISSLYNSYRKMPNLAKMIGFNYYGSVMLYNQLGSYENNFNKYRGDGTSISYGVGNLGFVQGQGFNQYGNSVSSTYGITINSSPVIYSKERSKTWIPFSH